MTRRRYRYNEETKALEEIDLEVPLAPRLEIQTGSHYEGLRATDGTAIDTPRRHRDYLKATGFAMADDFKQTTQQAVARRALEAREQRRETLGRITHQLENRSRRR